MKRQILLILDVLIIVFLVSLFIVPFALAQDDNPTSFLLEPFAPLLAASATVERSLQLVRKILSPDPETGLLARGSRALRAFTTYGSLTLGLILAFWGNIRLLSSVEIFIEPLVDLALTGIVIGMGSEVVHEIVSVVGEGKSALRATAEAKQEETAVG
jgi:hypothetical protein